MNKPLPYADSTESLQDFFRTQCATGTVEGPAAELLTGLLPVASRSQTRGGGVKTCRDKACVLETRYGGLPAPANAGSLPACAHSARPLYQVSPAQQRPRFALAALGCAFIDAMRPEH